MRNLLKTLQFPLFAQKTYLLAQSHRIKKIRFFFIQALIFNKVFQIKNWDECGEIDRNVERAVGIWRIRAKND